MENISQKLIVTHVPVLNKNMCVICRKCNKKFIKQTAATTLCNACWIDAKKNFKNGEGRKHFCDLCKTEMKASDLRISIAELTRDTSRILNSYQQKRIALYHKDCWINKILPILNKIKKRN